MSQSARNAMAMVLAVSAGLAGCAVGPRYPKPTTNLGPFHNLAGVGATKPEFPAPALESWWTGFNDPMLVTVVQRALDQNLDLAAAFARVRQARAAAAAAGAQPLPTADLEATGTAVHQSVVSSFGSVANGFPGYSRDQREYTVGAAASWEIDLSGGLRWALSLMGRRSSPSGPERCDGACSILERSKLRSPSRAVPMPKRLPSIGREP